MVSDLDANTSICGEAMCDVSARCDVMRGGTNNCASVRAEKRFRQTHLMPNDDRKSRSSRESPASSAPTTPRGGVRGSSSKVVTVAEASNAPASTGKLNSILDFLDKVEDSQKREERALESPRKIILAPIRQNLEAIGDRDEGML